MVVVTTLKVTLIEERAGLESYMQANSAIDICDLLKYLRVDLILRFGNKHDSNADHHTGTESQGYIKSAIQEWGDNTCLTFRPKNDADQDYVEFVYEVGYVRSLS